MEIKLASLQTDTKQIADKFTIGDRGLGKEHLKLQVFNRQGLLWATDRIRSSAQKGLWGGFRESIFHFSR